MDTTEEGIAVQKTIAAGFKFAKEQLPFQQHYRQNILGTDESKMELFERNTQKN